MPMAIPDDKCHAHVLELLERMGMPGRSITVEAAQWIALCCALSMPPEVTSELYWKMAQWVTLAETINLETLPGGAVAGVKADFFLGKISLEEVSDSFKQLVQRRKNTSKP